MRKILVFLLVTTLIFVSCSDDDNGDNGSIPAQVFEVDGVDFVYEANSNLYSAPFALEEYTSFDIREEDALLVYRYGSFTNVEGNLVDGWDLLPVKLYAEDDTPFEYNFSHFKFDSEIRITSDFDISNLGAGNTQNQIFRFVIIPSEWALNANINNMEEVLNALSIDSVERIDLNN